MVVRAMSDEMIKSWTRLTEGYANVEGVLFRRHETGQFEFFQTDQLEEWLTFMGFHSTRYVTFLPHPQEGSLANKKYI